MICLHCAEPIPLELAARGRHGMHAECLVRILFGSLAHQRRQHAGEPCHPDGCADSPAVTKHEAAFAAAGFVYFAVVDVNVVADKLRETFYDAEVPSLDAVPSCQAERKADR